MEEVKEEYAHLNSIHLWQCAQPPQFDATSVNSVSKMTAEQNEERKRLMRMIFFKECDMDQATINQSIMRPLPYEKYQEWIFVPKTDAPTTELGALHILPIEILDMIISHMDIATLDRFKAVNRRAFRVVNFHEIFKLLNEEAHDVLRAMRAVHVSHAYSLQAVFDALCSEKCTQCGDYGGYMYLAALERVCWRCLVTKDHYSPMREMAALESFGLTYEILENRLPRLQTYPGGYSFTEKMYDIPKITGGFVQLIDRNAAEQAGIARHGSREAMDAYVASTNPTVLETLKKEVDRREDIRITQRAEKWHKARNEWKIRMLLKMKVGRRITAREEEKKQEIRERKEQCARFDTLGLQPLIRSELLHEDTGGESVDSVSEIDEDSELHSLILDIKKVQIRAQIERNDTYDMRFLGTTRIPWLNRQAKRTEWGFHCVGCQHCQRRTGNSREREFIFPTFKDHLKECGPIEDGFHRCDCCDKGSCRELSGGRLDHALFWA